MEIDDLQVFVEVADAGGVSAAARRLGLPKSVVSRRLIRLEAAVGVQLVARTTRGAALTEAGREFRHHAARALLEIDAGREAIVPDGELRGRLRIALPLTFGPTHFTPVLAELSRRHPLLGIHGSYSDRFVDLVAEGFDCAIRVGVLRDSSLVARRVGPMGATLVASPAYVAAHGAPETPEDLLSHRVLMQGADTFRFLDGDNLITVQPRGHFTVDNGTALAVAATAGLGLAQLPDCLIHEDIASGALLPLMPRYPIPAVGAFVVRPPGRHPERKIRVLTELLVDLFATDPRFGRGQAG